MTLYSKDGYGWSGTPLPFDFQVAQIPIRLWRERVFHGDIVAMPPSSGAQRWRKKVLLLAPDESVYVYDTYDNRIHTLAELWPPPSHPFVREVMGSMYDDASLQRRLNRTVEEASGFDRLWGAKLIILTASLLAGLVGSAVVQWMLLGFVGPLTTAGGGLLSSILFWWRLRRWDWNALRRKQMLHFSLQSGLILAGLALPSGFIAFGDSLDTSDINALLAALAGYAGLGLFAGLICTIIGCDLVAWRTGGYADDPAAKLGFRHAS